MAPSTASSSSSATDSPSLASKALNQAKYVVTGGALVYYFGVGKEFSDVLHTSGLPSVIALASLAATLATISIFLYLLVYLPRFKRINPDVSGALSPSLRPYASHMADLDLSLRRHSSIPFWLFQTT
ncbi:hypothetical protein FRC04_011752 [Tulasnella sp. 424]|nr:hypothetical protein FRC04_011752 [Tulasnella sp. 424]KAG8978096.1 hypothetical protein FRC05_011212 [Tulasnella sp. 425]